MPIRTLRKQHELETVSGHLVWQIYLTRPNPALSLCLAALAGCMIWTIATSYQEGDAFTLAVPAFVLAVALGNGLYDIFKAFFRSYPVSATLEPEAFLVRYSKGEEKRIPYASVHRVKLSLVSPSTMIRQRSPELHFYDEHDNLLLKGDVVKGENLIALRDALGAVGIHIFIPSYAWKAYRMQSPGSPS